MCVWRAICLGLFAVGLNGCGDPEAAWREARAADTPEAYAEYLAEYPEAHHAEEARVRQGLHEAWLRATGANTVEGWTRFAAEHGTSEFAAEAWDRYLTSLAAECAADSPREAEELLRTRRLDAGSDAELRAARIELLWTMHASLQPVERIELRNAGDRGLQRIRILDDPSVPRAEGHLRPRPSYRYGQIDVTGRAAIVDDQGRPSSTLLSAGAGTLLVDDLGRYRSDLIGHLELEGVDAGVELRPATSGGLLDFQMDWQGAVQPLVPLGAGSTYTVTGTVTGLLAGWTLVGDAEDPLVLRALEDGGLAYLCGSGSVTGPDAAEISLPAAWTGAGPWPDLSRPGSVARERELAEPSMPSIGLARRRISVDTEGELVWLRSDAAASMRPLLLLDLEGSRREHEGVEYVRVSSGADVLDPFVTDGASDLLRDEDGTWISTDSLRCDDTWERFWDESRERSWYRRRTDFELILRRFYKQTDETFERDFGREVWLDHGKRHDPSRTTEELTVKVDPENGGLYFSGSLVMAMGSNVDPVGPLYTSLVKHSYEELMLLFQRLGHTEERATELANEVLALRKYLSSGSTTIGQLIERIGEHCPELHRMLADPTTNHVQIIAEAVDPSAGSKAFGFGFGGGGGGPDFEPFRYPGSTYELELDETTPYPLSDELSVWGGRILVVEDVDGRPRKHLEDGTEFRLRLTHGLERAGHEAGSVSLDLRGTCRKGRPAGLDRLEREGEYSLGPIEADRLTWTHEEGGAALELSPLGERIVMVP